ncbi:Clp protease N-terminal domain-containing protein [Actinomadura sp. 6N118]|uniref:Clp protease N-terminal domain-containing protein n=1 Tax=Actinomadura sp. 6N118 TaxID=3375151 RepID=UPI0037B1C563
MNAKMFGLHVCVDDAFLYAWRRGHSQVGTAHLLLALVGEGDPVGSRALLESGVTYAALNALLSQGSWLEEHAEPVDPAVSLQGHPSASTTWRRGPIWKLMGLFVPPGRPDPPDLPRPRWTTAMRSVLLSDHNSRAAQLLALLAHADCTAREALIELGVSPDRLLREVTEAYGSDGPRAIGPFDGGVSPAGHVLRWALRAGPYEHPGRPGDLPWRSGLLAATSERTATAAPEHIVAAMLAVYEELSADDAQFGAGWESCFPAVIPLVESGMTAEIVADLPAPVMSRVATYFLPVVKEGHRRAATILGHSPRREDLFTVETLLLGALGRPSLALDEQLTRFGLDRAGLAREVAEPLRRRG